METLGSFLKQLRQNRSFTLGQLSVRSGVNKGTLSRWENGTYYPRIPELLCVLSALDVSSSAQVSSLRLLEAPRAIHAERSNAGIGTGALTRLSLGDLLFGLRQRAGKTQAEAARATGISRSLYSQWENDVNQPTTSLLHTVGYALGASVQEVVALSSCTLSHAPIEKSREALLQQYIETIEWGDGVTQESHTLHLLSLLANFGNLWKAGKADPGDIALIINDFGDGAEMWHNDLELRNHYHRRALALAAQANEPVHFHIVTAVRSLMDARSNLDPIKKRLADALKWRPRFRDKAGQAYLLSFIASEIAKEAPDEALRLADQYCALVADNPDEYPCRLRDRGNLLFKCGRPAESVAFIAALNPQDSFREGLKQLEMARGLAAMGAATESQNCLIAGKRVLSAMGHNYGPVKSMIDRLEHIAA